MSRKYFVLHASFEDDEVLLDAVKATKEANYEIAEVYTPFPVHGLDKAMGLKPTRIAIAAFLFGFDRFFNRFGSYQLHYDCRLATKFWRKAQRHLHGQYACLCNYII